MELTLHSPTEGVYRPAATGFMRWRCAVPNECCSSAAPWGFRPDFTAPPTLDEQLECVWKNIRAILASAGMTTDNKSFD